MAKQPTSVSPARAAGLINRPRRKASWTEGLVLPLWTRVALKCDPRHEGEVSGTAGVTITVRWDNGWKSEHTKGELQGAE